MFYAAIFPDMWVGHICSRPETIQRNTSHLKNKPIAIAFAPTSADMNASIKAVLSAIRNQVKE